ncbi:MAG: FtsX-like permease family protein [Fimbriimonadales bacterium]|nr:FtsX-like permease family protein [Fimbriimonadales bacterium]
MKQKDPPISVALKQAMKSIRMRMLRQFATAFGVLLGIAFYASVRTSLALSESDPEAVEGAVKLRWLVFLSLLMCLVGITNAMLMSVTERYKEIGTFKCLGATNSFIVKVFFLEALLIGVLSSTAGAFLGFGIMVAVRVFTDGASSLSALGSGSLPILLSAIGIGTLITILAAILPAIQAARMPAAAALRVEV